MFRFSVFGWLKSGQQQSRGAPRQLRGNPAVPPRRTVLRLETLEDRVQPSTFTVLNLADSGPGSLRAAITAANLTPGANVIQFAGGLHGTIPLSSTNGELSITRDLMINGPGANQLTVSGGNVTRVFDVSGGSTHLSMTGLTIANGLAVPTTFVPGLAAFGGGLLNNGANVSLSQD